MATIVAPRRLGQLQRGEHAWVVGARVLADHDDEVRVVRRPPARRFPCRRRASAPAPRRSTRGTCSSSRAGCWCRAGARAAGRGTPPRCSCGRRCRRRHGRGRRARTGRRPPRRTHRPSRWAVVVAPRRTVHGWVSRPCWPSQWSVWAASSTTECVAKNSGPTRRTVASSATAFAPFSQNSRCDAWCGSGQAQPGQSKPSGWFTFRSVAAARRTPSWSRACCTDAHTPGRPAATVFGRPTRRVGSFAPRRLAPVGSRQPILDVVIVAMLPTAPPGRS